jgi:hypothetical protein
MSTDTSKISQSVPKVKNQIKLRIPPNPQVPPFLLISAIFIDFRCFYAKLGNLGETPLIVFHARQV